MNQEASATAPRLLGTLTIGQAPRPDITPILESALPAGTRCVHAGVLDGLSKEQIAQRYVPRPGEPVLVSRLLDGSSVKLDKAAVRETLALKLRELEDQGCTVVLILCTGEFHGLDLQRAWLVEPDRIVPPAAAALAVTGPASAHAHRYHHQYYHFARRHRMPLRADRVAASYRYSVQPWAWQCGRRVYAVYGGGAVRSGVA